MSKPASDLSRQPADAFFWKYVHVEPNTGCWLWAGYGDGRGYGFARSRGRNWRAHRLAWEILRGSIPVDMTIDHLCKVKCCVNPDHMEVVTAAENTLRADTFSGLNARKESCPSGHIYVGNNIKWYQGRRYCRACHQKYNRERQ
jgi:hypothetical protein